jgi:16S rRNA (uracil1498-N3)-methyltransferase
LFALVLRLEGKLLVLIPDPMKNTIFLKYIYNTGTTHLFSTMYRALQELLYMTETCCEAGMKNLFLQSDSLQDRKVVIQKENYHYLKNVRRIQKGDLLDAVIDRTCYRLEVSSILDTRIECRILKQRAARNQNAVKISVYQGLLKVRKMDLVIAKLGEMEVNRFQPLITERTIPRDLGENRMHRWVKLAQEGAKITGSESIMRIAGPSRLDEVLKNLKKAENTVIIIFNTEYVQFQLRTYLESLEPKGGLHIHLFFGPEGGFSDREMGLAAALNAVPVTMGPSILKSETASIVGTGFIRLFFS